MVLQEVESLAARLDPLIVDYWITLFQNRLIVDQSGMENAWQKVMEAGIVDSNIRAEIKGYALDPNNPIEERMLARTVGSKLNTRESYVVEREYLGIERDDMEVRQGAESGGIKGINNLQFVVLQNPSEARRREAYGELHYNDQRLADLFLAKRKIGLQLQFNSLELYGFLGYDLGEMDITEISSRYGDYFRKINFERSKRKRQLAKEKEINDELPWNGDYLGYLAWYEPFAQVNAIANGLDYKEIARKFGWQELLRHIEIYSGENERHNCWPINPPTDVRVTLSQIRGFWGSLTALGELGHAYDYASKSTFSNSMLNKSQGIDGIACELCAALAGELLTFDSHLWKEETSPEYLNYLEMLFLLGVGANTMMQTEFENWIYGLDHDPSREEVGEQHNEINRKYGSARYEVNEWVNSSYLGYPYLSVRYLGYLAALQMKDWARKQIGNSNEEYGRWIVDEVFSRHGLMPWRQIVREAIGEEFDPLYLLRKAEGRDLLGFVKEYWDVE